MTNKQYLNDQIFQLKQVVDCINDARMTPEVETFLNQASDLVEEAIDTIFDIYMKTED